MILDCSNMAILPYFISEKKKKTCNKASQLCVRLTPFHAFLSFRFSPLFSQFIGQLFPILLQTPTLVLCTFTNCISLACSLEGTASPLPWQSEPSWTTVLPAHTGIRPRGEHKPIPPPSRSSICQCCCFIDASQSGLARPRHEPQSPVCNCIDTKPMLRPLCRRPHLIFVIQVS